MMWNPEISNWKMKDFEKTLRHFMDGELNWAVFDYEKVKVNDRFFMVKCGNGNTGIVMSGIIVSKPYKDEDWSGKSREVYYVKVSLGGIVHPDHEPILTTEELAKEIPDFEWNGGHSGRLLDKLSAGKLELLWQTYIAKNKQIFDEGDAELDVFIEEGACLLVNEYLKRIRGKTCELCGFNYNKVFGKSCRASIEYVKLPSSKGTTPQKSEDCYHGLCPNCLNIVNTIEDFEKYKLLKNNFINFKS